MDSLSTEILHHLCRYLDIFSIYALSQTNQYIDSRVFSLLTLNNCLEITLSNPSKKIIDRIFDTQNNNISFELIFKYHYLLCRRASDLSLADLLYSACSNGHLNFIKHIVNLPNFKWHDRIRRIGITDEAKNRNTIPYILLAAENEHYMIVQYLIDNTSVNLCVRDNNGRNLKYWIKYHIEKRHERTFEWASTLNESHPLYCHIMNECRYIVG